MLSNITSSNRHKAIREKKMKKVALALTVLCALVTSTEAKNFRVPSKNPVVSVTIPDSWKTEEIDFGYNAQSSDGSVVFFIEYASAKNIDAMMKNNKNWMEENEIIVKGEPVVTDVLINELPARVMHYEATDDDGDTTVDFVFMDASSDRVIMFTLWGSKSDLEENAVDIASIKASIKPLKK